MTDLILGLVLVAIGLRLLTHYLYRRRIQHRINETLRALRNGKDHDLTTPVK